MAFVVDSIRYEEWILFYYKYVTLFPRTRHFRAQLLAGRITSNQQKDELLCFYHSLFFNVPRLIKRTFLENLLLVLHCQIKKRSFLPFVCFWSYYKYVQNTHGCLLRYARPFSWTIPKKLECQRTKSAAYWRAKSLVSFLSAQPFFSEAQSTGLT